MKILIIPIFLLFSITSFGQLQWVNLPQENQAESALEQNNYPMAIRLYEEALEIRKAKFPEGIHTSLSSLMEISKAIDNMGSAYGKSGNYQKEIEFSKEQSEWWRTAMKQYPDETTPYLEYGFAQIQMAESYQSLTDYSKGISICEDLIQFYQNLPDRRASRFVAKQIIPFAHSRAGDILKDQGDLQASVRHHEESVRRWLDNLKQLKETLVYEEIAKQSEICVQRYGKLEDSLNVIKYAEIAMKHYEILANMDPENEEYIREVMTSSNTLGIYKSARGEYEEAIGHYKKSLEVNNDQFIKKQDFDYIKQIAALHLKISQCYQALENTKEAANQLAYRIQRLKQYQDLNSSVDYSYTISNEQNRLAVMYEELDRPSDALIVLDESIDMGQIAIQRDPDNSRKKQWSWIQEFHRYQLLRELKDYETAKTSMDRLKTIFTTLESDEPGIQYSEHLKEVEVSRNELEYPDIVDLDAEIEALEESPEKFEKSKILVNALRKKMKKDPNMQLSFVKHTSALAWTGLMTGNYRESSKALKKAMRIKPVDPYLITNYAPCLLFMGKYKKAEKVYQKYFDKPFKPGEKMVRPFLRDFQSFEEKGKIPQEHSEAVNNIIDKLNLWANK